MTTNTLIIIFLFISFVTNVFLLFVTVHNCRSEKKNWFVFCLISTVFFILGNFMEGISHSTEAALSGVKVMYVGACYMAPLFLLFTMDYCEINLKRKLLHKLLRTLLLALPTVNLFLVWTTEYTRLIYKEFTFTADATVRGLQIVSQGPLYYLVYGTALVCILASIAIAVARMIKWNRRARLSLFLLLISGAAPLIANGLYILSSYIFKTDLHGVNLTPFALVVTYILFYVNVLRYDLFDFTPRARSATLDMIRDGILFLDTQLNYTSSNAIARSLFPGLRAFGKGRPIAELPEWPEELRGLDAGESGKNIRFSLPGADGGDAHVFNAWVNTVRSGDKALSVVIIIQDVTDNILLMQRLEDAAYTDGLTGLYNRKHFMELVSMQLEHARRADTRSCFLLFDLDLFKNVNDTFGHLAGDEVLRFVAQNVRRTVRAYDLVARYGGEEFVVFLADTDAELAARLAERIRENIAAAPCVYEDIEIPVTCSIGVTQTRGDDSIDDVLKRADSAMYRAKETGRNRVCVL
ncbi:MAG: diguanylate cyclase [Oscillospiraceae bacterium]|nr:diguanylate cyclase [Oscillospiraceae bacterium]